MAFAGGLTLAESVQAEEWVHGAGWQIWDDATAQEACPSVCSASNMSYAGYWEDDGSGSYTSWCYCDANQAGYTDPGYSDPGYTDNTTADPGYVDPGTITPPAYSGGGGGGDFNSQILQAHNTVRANHGAPALSWSAQLQASAQEWAQVLQSQGCNLQHSPRGKYQAGENLWGGWSSGGALNAAKDSVDGWYWCEIGQYQPGMGFTYETGHYTQVIWRSTTQLGCAQASCGQQQVSVCHYSQPGNMAGAFDQNVAHQYLQKPAGIRCN
ncbi:CAP family protein [Antarctobacter jejuensis]|uniref:CAP family protein n=1 Tax=Antarctobacter jejuensis TaxID=1439938 RepID=UPI003FD47630